MSAQFGRWSLDGRPVGEEYLSKVTDLVAPYGPDASGLYRQGGIVMTFQALHTAQESRRQRQPHTSRHGAILMWDGRLDNRLDLIRHFGQVLTNEATDLEIVATAYEEWRERGLARLVGDWALSIWDPGERSVILAKDFIGTRHLYYSLDPLQLSWCTILEPLLLVDGKSFRLNEEYIAGWLSFFPAAHLTPYEGIQSVPPSSFVRISAGRIEVQRYWDFDPKKRIRYRGDADYEEHFRHLFGEAVRRRLHSDARVLAELSGGMDSSAIVCMADRILNVEPHHTPGLDTISYYDDAEPNWNERPYFTVVEEHRGREGRHIDIGNGDHRLVAVHDQEDGFWPTPSAMAAHSAVTSNSADCLTSQAYRALLSGTGGDEVMGGVPTPIPELADLLAQLRFRALAHQLKIWALTKRSPWICLLWETGREFLSSNLTGNAIRHQHLSWICDEFLSRNRRAMAGYPSRLKFFGPLPSFQGNVATLEALRRQLATTPPPRDARYEKRYPYLDRDLLEFIYAIPREQLIRPGQRRSLMRRALVGIVPAQILNRKRKAFAVRSPTKAIVDGANIAKSRLVSSKWGFINSEAFNEVVQAAEQGQEVPVVPVLRTLALELWLRRLDQSELIGSPSRQSF